MSGELSLLSGRRGIVLGVSGPDTIGYRTAEAFRRAGAEVALSYRAERRASVERLAHELGCAGVVLDARDETSVARAFEEVGRRFERIDFLVHTLVHVPEGVLERNLTDISSGEFADVMEIGVRSLLVCVRHALPWLTKSDAARVVTLLSPGANRTLSRYHAVGIAKGALASAVRYLALELGPRGVLCNAVNFSIVETAAARRVIGSDVVEKSRSYLERRSATRRATGYDDVVHAIAYLASPLCRNVTGETLNVDGGFSHTYL